jgi:hypothetical protein
LTLAFDSSPDHLFGTVQGLAAALSQKHYKANALKRVNQKLAESGEQGNFFSLAASPKRLQVKSILSMPEKPLLQFST